MPRAPDPESHSASPPEQKARPAPVSTIVRTSSRLPQRAEQLHELDGEIPGDRVEAFRAGSA